MNLPEINRINKEIDALIYILENSPCELLVQPALDRLDEIDVIFKNELDRRQKKRKKEQRTHLKVVK